MTKLPSKMILLNKSKFRQTKMAGFTKISSVIRCRSLLQSRFEPLLRQTCRCSHSNGPQKQSIKKLLWTPFTTTLRHLGKLSGSSKLAPAQSQDQSRFRRLFKPFAFTVLVSVSSFSGAIVWQYETLRSIYQERLKPQSMHDHQFYGKAGSFRLHMNTIWNQLSPGRKLVAEIIGVNLAVFLLWRIRPLENYVAKFFTSTPFSGASCSSMLLSTFSHRSLVHLGCNMFVLWSFSAPVTQSFGKEQFLAFFLSAGVISSFTGYINKVVRLSLVPSVGASGAILAVIGAVCCQFPDSRLSVILIDQIIPHSFSADSAMKGIIVFDLMGIIFGWRILDHAAHLGGMLFGIWYAKYGSDIIWRRYREPVMKLWHDCRGKA